VIQVALQWLALTSRITEIFSATRETLPKGVFGRAPVDPPKLDLRMFVEKLSNSLEPPACRVARG
jgi:hypothetical protein